MSFGLPQPRICAALFHGDECAGIGGMMHTGKHNITSLDELQLAHLNIPGENDFTYVAHKVYGYNMDPASDTATTASAESAVVTSEEEGGGMDNCATDPDEFCMVYAGCAPLFRK